MQTKTQSGFLALHVAPALCNILEQAGIHTPTPIQAQAIPLAMDGGDVIGIAQTGTGKTLAFGLPMVARLGQGEMGLVLAPTRELAQQISETYHKLGVVCTLIVGGAPMGKQIRDLKRNPKVIVATPGRLIDHLDQGTTRLDRVSIVVLDEADRMLDMGFAPAIKRILGKVPTKRQTMLFSATMPREIADLAKQYLDSPQRVDVAPQGTASELVDQELLFVGFDEKPTVLAGLLKEHSGTVLVFARTRHGARKLARSIRMQGHTAAELHSDRSLPQRREALQGFKDGNYRVLVATDICARGIDVKEISLVVNYDVPEKPEDYVHRIGRTGRAGVEGRAITLALPDQTKDVRDIERLLGKSLRVSRRSTVTPPPTRTNSGSKPASRPILFRSTSPAVEPKPAQPAPVARGHRGWSGKPKRQRAR